MTTTELLDTFSDNLTEIRRICVEHVQASERRHRPWQKWDEASPLTEDAIRKHVNFLIVQNETEHQRHIVRRIDARRRKPRSGRINDAQIQQARDVPLEELYEGKLYGRYKERKGLCPFHEERTPSFTIYTKDNHFHCYGCQAHGSAIDFVMLRDNCDFISSVKKLV